jgi:hypothetical protein
MSPYSTVTPAARNKCQVEKDDDIKPSADQIRQGEGVKQMTVKTSNGQGLFWFDPPSIG